VLAYDWSITGHLTRREKISKDNRAEKHKTLKKRLFGHRVKLYEKSSCKDVRGEERRT